MFFYGWSNFSLIQLLWDILVSPYSFKRQFKISVLGLRFAVRVIIGVKHLAVMVKEIGNALQYVNEPSQQLVNVCIVHVCQTWSFMSA